MNEPACMSTIAHLKERIAKLEDELGDWHATFPGKTAEDVIQIMSTQQKQIERLLEARKAEGVLRVKAERERDEAVASAKYWLEQHALEASKRGECEHQLDEARGSLAEQFERIERERDEALAKCAEMRRQIGTIKYAVENNQPIPWLSMCDRMAHALSTDCGKGWRSPEQFAKELEPTIQFLKMALEPVFPGTWLDEEGHRELFRLEKLLEASK